MLMTEDSGGDDVMIEDSNAGTLFLTILLAKYILNILYKHIPHPTKYHVNKNYYRIAFFKIKRLNDIILLYYIHTFTYTNMYALIHTHTCIYV